MAFARAWLGSLALSVSLGAAVVTVSAASRADEPLTCSRANVHHHLARHPALSRYSGPPGSGSVQYYGGHVITHVQVVPVNWGSQVAPQIASAAEGFYKAIVDSPYLDWMGEYDTAGKNGATDGQPGSGQHVYRGTTSSTVTITPSTTSTSITDADIQNELLAQIKSGKLPAPQVDAEGGVDTIYMLLFPPGVTIDDGSGAQMCQDWCAYHGAFQMNGVAAGVPYAVMPDTSQMCTQCGQGNAFELYTQSASHELAEAITDAEAGLTQATEGRPLAWLDPNSQAGEVGDICENDASNFVSYRGFVVQKIWSQRLGQCITEDPNLTICNGQTRPCRPCSAQDCSGATPACDTDPKSAKWGQCVGCQTNAQCTQAGKGICDSGTGACRGCTGDADCGGATGKCETGSGACVACLADADCKDGSSTCNTSTHACVPKAGGSGNGNGSPNGNGNGSGNGSGNNADGSAGTGAQSGGCAMSPEGSPNGGAGVALAVGVLAFVGRRRRR